VVAIFSSASGRAAAPRWDTARGCERYRGASGWRRWCWPRSTRLARVTHASIIVLAYDRRIRCWITGPQAGELLDSGRRAAAQRGVGARQRRVLLENVGRRLGGYASAQPTEGQATSGTS